jgi:hypothetical protein
MNNDYANEIFFLNCRVDLDCRQSKPFWNNGAAILLSRAGNHHRIGYYNNVIALTGLWI